jgi:hypothetical protein
VSRVRVCWRGKVRAVGQSPFHAAPVIALTVEVIPHTVNPVDQLGRLVQVELTPARARALGDRLYALAAKELG